MSELTKQVTNKDTNYYILSLIGIAIMFGFGFLPPIAPITPLGMRVLGVFIGVIFYGQPLICFGRVY